MRQQQRIEEERKINCRRNVLKFLPKNGATAVAVSPCKCQESTAASYRLGRCNGA